VLLQLDNTCLHLRLGLLCLHGDDVLRVPLCLHVGSLYGLWGRRQLHLLLQLLLLLPEDLLSELQLLAGQFQLLEPQQGTL